MGLNRSKNRIKLLLGIFLFSLIAFSLPAIGQYQENSDENNIKRVICLVFDDSGSMLNDGQSYDYASYALQNVIGLMNDQDELAVAKLSDAGKIIEYHNSGYNERVENILAVKNYSNVAESTDFMVVDAAANYLKDKKSQYGDNNNYKYYFVVLTDGKFDNYPRKLSEYLANLKAHFVNSYFKGIFIGIGSDLQESMEQDVLANDNYYYLKAQGRDDIVNATFKAHDIIYNRNAIPESELSLRNGGELLSFYAEKNVKRILVFEQDQDANVSSISSKDVYMDNKQTFTTSKSRKPALMSHIIYTNAEKGTIPNGNVVLEFDKPITKSSDKLRIMVEYADSETEDKIIIETNDSISPTDHLKPITDSTDTEIVPQETTSPIYPSDEMGDLSDSDHTLVANHFCICPILRILLIIFLIGLIISLIDKSRNNDHNNGIILFIILILIDLLLFVLCHLLWCKLPWSSCLTHFKLLPIGGGHGRAILPITTGPIPSPAPGPGPKPYAPPVVYKFLPIAPFIGLALLLGYIFKNRFDTKYHAFEKSVGNELERSTAIKVNGWTKFIPYMPETGYGSDIFLKASKKKDRVIIPKKYLTDDMLRDGQEISRKDDFTLFEDIPFTRVVNGQKVTYLYKSYKKFEKNT